MKPNILKQIYQIFKLKIYDFLTNIFKNEKFDLVDENPTFNLFFMRVTNPNEEELFHIAVPYEQELGKEYFVLCDHWSRYKCIKCAKISFYEPKYIIDNLILGKKKWILNSNEKERLMNFLNSSLENYSSSFKYTNWLDIINTYNSNTNSIEIPENLQIPNYLNLSK